MRRKFTFIAICCLTAAVAVLAGCGSKQNGAPAQAQQSPSVKPEPKAQKADWEIEWEKTVELGKKEGEVVIFGQAKTDREQLVLEFEKAYPGIKVKYTGMRPSQSGPKILAEQAQGKYLADIFLEVPPKTPSAEALDDIVTAKA